MTVQTVAKNKTLSACRKLAAAFVLSCMLFHTPRAALAVATHIEDADHYDGRVQNYDPDVELPPASNGMTWFLVLTLGVVCVSVMFKDAKRSHLD